jgi:hypothetical protein
MNPLKYFQRRKSIKDDYVETFSTPHGQRVLNHILRQAGVTDPRFHSDPATTQFYEGHRHLAMSIFRQVHSSPEHLTGLISGEIKRREIENKESNDT